MNIRKRLSRRISRVEGFVPSTICYMVAVLALATGSTALPAPTLRADRPQKAAKATKPSAARTLARLPLSFEANRGQVDEVVRYLARGDGFDLFLTAQEVVFTVDRPIEPGAKARHLTAASFPNSNHPSTERSVLEMQFVGGAKTLVAEAVEPLPGVVNYLVGRDPKAWSTGVPTFREVRYRQVWEGIDVVFHGRRERLEYDFEVAPGVDHGRIELAFSGADHLGIDPEGSLVVTMDGTRQLHRVPKVIQDPKGTAVELKGRFVLRGKDRVGFELENRDPRLALLVDPEVVYVTPFFGGSDIDNVFSLDVGDDGQVTIAGYTGSLDFPGVGPTAYQPVNPTADYTGFRAAGLVARLSQDGSHIEWATYLAGSASNDTKVWRVKVDRRGRAYVCGYTSASDFPTTPNGYDRSLGGYADGIVAVLASDGTDLLYSSFLGGAGDEFLFGCALVTDHHNVSMAVTGYTNSSDFPLVHAEEATFNDSGALDAVVAVVDVTGRRGLLYSSLIPGGSRDEIGNDIAVRGDTLFVTGETASGPRRSGVSIYAWQHAVEDGRGVAQLSLPPTFPPPTSPGYANGWNKVLTKAFALPQGQVGATFVARWETEEDYDFLRFRISTDDGATWIVLEQLDGFSNGFEQRLVDLTAYAGRAVLLQFQFTSDGYVSDIDGGIDTNGEAIDSIAVTGYAPDDFTSDLDGWVASDDLAQFPADFHYGELGFTDAFIAAVKPFRRPGHSPRDRSMRVATIGGEDFDTALQIAVAPDGTVFALGQTTSTAFPTTRGAYQEQVPGPAAVPLWIASWTPDLSRLTAATHLGGSSGFQYPNGLDIDRKGRVILSGISDAPDFPLVEPIDVSPPFGNGGDRDYILSVLSPNLRRLLHSSKFGDPGWELGGEVKAGHDGFVYALGRRRDGGADAGATQDLFVLKLKLFGGHTTSR